MHRQVRHATDAGIDGFVCAGFGRVVAVTCILDRAFSTFLDVAEIDDFQLPIDYGLMDDGFEEPTRQCLRRWPSYTPTTYGEHPAYWRIGTRPVVVVCNSSRASPSTRRGVL